MKKFTLGSLPILGVMAFLAMACDDTPHDPDPSTDSASDTTIPTDTDSHRRDPLCDATEYEADLIPVKKDMVILLERSYLMYVSSFGLPVFEAVGALVHEMEEFIDLAFFIFPGKGCTSINEDDLVVGCDASDNMLFGFGTENPGEVLDAELLGWDGLGFCGREAMVPGLNSVWDYLESDTDRVETDILFVGASRSACNPIAMPGCPNSFYCPTDIDCSVSGLTCTDQQGAENTARRFGNSSAGYRLHFAMFSTNPDIGGVSRQLSFEAGTFPAYFAQDHAQVGPTFDKVRKRFYSCRFELDWTSLSASLADTQDQGLINFFLDGKPLEYSTGCAAGHGWQWLDEQTIELCTNTCDALTEESVMAGITFEASFGCESFTGTLE